VAGVDPADLADPAAAHRAIEKAQFVVSLELRESDVTRAADVVFPVAPVSDKAGMFVNWEGRVRPFDQVLHVPSSLPDLRVLAGIADEMGVELGFRTVDQVRAEMATVGPWDGKRSAAPEGSTFGSRSSTGVTTGNSAAATSPEDASRSRAGSSAAVSPDVSGSQARPSTSGLVLASWKQLLDDGRMQDGDEHLRATARRPVLLVNATTLADLGVTAGDSVRVTGPLGSLDLPVGLADLAAGVVWAPASAPGAPVRHLVGPAGCTVTVAATGSRSLSVDGGIE